MSTGKLSILLFLVFVAGSASARNFEFTNNCPQTVWVGMWTSPDQVSPDTVVSSGQSAWVSTSDDWIGRFWGKTGCTTDSSGQQTCITGVCEPYMPCAGVGGIPPATLAEFHLTAWDNLDFFDISLVDGFNLPMTITPSVSSCKDVSCNMDMNAVCPSELQQVNNGIIEACLSACNKFNSDNYCCEGAYNSANTCGPTNYSEIFKNACPFTFSYPFDYVSSSFACSNADYTITFC